MSQDLCRRLGASHGRDKLSPPSSLIWLPQSSSPSGHEGRIEIVTIRNSSSKSEPWASVCHSKLKPHPEVMVQASPLFSTTFTTPQFHCFHNNNMLQVNVSHCPFSVNRVSHYVALGGLELAK